MRIARIFRVYLILGVLAAGLTAGAVTADEAMATARQLLATGHEAQAVTVLKQMIADFPRDPLVRDASLLLANCYLNQEEYALALPLYARVLELAPGQEFAALRAETFFYAGECHRNLHAYEQAVRAYDNSLQLAPTPDLTVRTQYWRASSLYVLHRWPEALAGYRAALQGSPTHALAPWSLYAIGLLEHQQGRPAEAVTALERLTAEYKDGGVDRCETALALAAAYLMRGQKAEGEATTRDAQRAIGILTAALVGATPAQRQRIHLTLARARETLDDQAGAAAAYAAALEAMGPETREAQETRLARGHALYNAEQYADAAAEYARVAAGKDTDELVMQALYWLGNSRYLQAREEKSRKPAEEGIAALRRFRAAAGPQNERTPRATLLIALSHEHLLGLGVDEARTTAVTAYREVLAGWPTTREATEANAGLARLAGALSTEELEQLANTLPAGGAAREVALRLAQVYFRAEQYPQAIAQAQQVLNATPTGETRAAAAYLLAASRHRLDQPAEAIPLYAQALQHSKDAELIRFTRRGQVRALLATKRFPEARDAAQAFVALPTPNGLPAMREAEIAERHLLLAEACIGLEQYDEARTAYRHIIDTCPTSPLVPDALMGMAWVAEQRDDTADAIAAYRGMLERYADHARADDAAFWLGIALRKTQQPAKAAEALARVPADHPHADHAAYLSAWCRLEQDQADEALAGFLRVAELFPASPLVGESLYQAGLVLISREQYTEARKPLARALERLPAGHALRPATAYRLGVCAFQVEDYPAAATAFSTAAATKDELATEALFWKALSLERQGDAQAAAARSAYRQYSQLDADGLLAADARLGAGRVALALRQYADARTELRAALALCAVRRQHEGPAAERAKNVQPEAQFTLAQTFAAERQYVEAITAYAAVAAYPLEPWYSRALLEMARCGALAGNPEAAVRTLRRLITDLPDSEGALAAPALAEQLGLELAE